MSQRVGLTAQGQPGLDIEIQTDDGTPNITPDEAAEAIITADADARRSQGVPIDQYSFQFGSVQRSFDQLVEVAGRETVARRLFQRGEDLFNRHNYQGYQGAIAEYRASYRLSPQPAILYNIANSFRDLDRPELELHYLRRYLSRNPEPRPEARIEEVEQRVRVLETRLPREAEDHFDNGYALYGGRHFEEAIVEYRASYRLSPQPAILYNIASCYRGLGRPAEEQHYLEEYLRTASPEAPRRRGIQDRIAELQRQATPEPVWPPQAEASPAATVTTPAPGEPAAATPSAAVASAPAPEVAPGPAVPPTPASPTGPEATPAAVALPPAPPVQPPLPTAAPDVGPPPPPPPSGEPGTLRLRPPGTPPAVGRPDASGDRMTMVTLPPGVSAPPPPPPEETPEAIGQRDANQHYQRATTLYNERNYQGALQEYLEAYRILPNHTVTLAIASCHQALGHWQEEIEFLRRYLREAPAEDQNRLQIGQKIQLIEAVQGTTGLVTLPTSGAIQSWLQANAVNRILEGFFTSTDRSRPFSPLSPEWANSLVVGLPPDPVRSGIQTALVRILNQLNGTEQFTTNFPNLISLETIRALTPTSPPAGAEEPAVPPSPAGTPAGVSATPVGPLAIAFTGHPNGRYILEQRGPVIISLASNEELRGVRIHIEYSGSGVPARDVPVGRLQPGQRSVTIFRNLRGIRAGSYTITVRRGNSDIARSTLEVMTENNFNNLEKRDFEDGIKNSVRGLIERLAGANGHPNGRIYVRYKIGADRRLTEVTVSGATAPFVTFLRSVASGSQEPLEVFQRGVSRLLTGRPVPESVGHVDSQFEVPILYNSEQ